MNSGVFFPTKDLPCVVQEKNVEETQVKVHEAKASGEEALASALQNHAKELQELQGQVETAQQQRCISEEKCQILKEEVEELVPFKEKAQVRKKMSNGGPLVYSFSC